MGPEQFLEWRKSLGMSHAEAADRLGVSKRSIFNYEGSGPIPRTVELACKALTNELRNTDYRSLVKEQHAKLGEFVLVLPYIIERHSSYAKALEVTPSSEIQEWLQEQSMTATFSIKVVITPEMERREIPIFVFENEDDRFYFQTRWS